ncbi:hypothetical protein EJB05_27612 [Eragrostis curvula]|uniref:Uncharacterized protein n=1 Tax=Eragrostis curvula TaxID=38414 RepID=A0A5J9UPF6_9POAL|nr:hypothetical protein EJB05_27612 [Eragrostis curvula]
MWQFGYIVPTISAGIMDYEEARRKNVSGRKVPGSLLKAGGASSNMYSRVQDDFALTRQKNENLQAEHNQ